MFDPLLEASREATYTGIKVLNIKMLNFVEGWSSFMSKEDYVMPMKLLFLLISQNAQPKYYLLKQCYVCNL